MTVKELQARVEALEKELADLKAATPGAGVHYHYHYEKAEQPQPTTYPYGQWPYQWWWTTGVEVPTTSYTTN